MRLKNAHLINQALQCSSTSQYHSESVNLGLEMLEDKLKCRRMSRIIVQLMFMINSDLTR